MKLRDLQLPGEPPTQPSKTRECGRLRGGWICLFLVVSAVFALVDVFSAHEK